MVCAAKWFRGVLECITIGLFTILTVVVVLAVVARYVFNASFSWYDEVASVLLAWITYYGAAYAALFRRHLGFSELVLALPPRARLAAFVCAEVVVYATFILLAWAGWRVLDVMAGETLVSLEWVPLQVTQSIVPIGCVLFLAAQVLSTPAELARLRQGQSAEEEEIATELARAGVQAEGADAPAQGRKGVL